jgi:hypothetical protein
MRRGLLVAVVAVVAALTVTVSAFHQHSVFYKTVESDPSWLAYLPAGNDGLDLVPAGLTAENATGNDMRRVDLTDAGREEIASLCFASTRKAVLRACPGSTYLGRSTRDGMELPAMSQIGRSIGSRDWLNLLSSPTPRLEDVDYLDG